MDSSWHDGARIADGVLRAPPRAQLTQPQLMPANGETPHLMHVRWAKLRKDLYAVGNSGAILRNSAQLFCDPSSNYRYKPKKDQFDTSKLPDLYDNAMHDVIHNAHLNLRYSHPAQFPIHTPQLSPIHR